MNDESFTLHSGQSGSSLKSSDDPNPVEKPLDILDKAVFSLKVVGWAERAPNV